jgi:O-antigen/teichoic acid export membrane protein
MNLARGAARGAAWNFATVLFERGFGFVILGILLRHIPASTVGVVAIGSAIADLGKDGDRRRGSRAGSGRT